MRSWNVAVTLRRDEPDTDDAGSSGRREISYKPSRAGSSRRSVMATFVLASLALATACHAEDWAGWRGPDRNGISHESGVPVKWSPEEGVRWNTPLPGSGISSPIIWGDRVFVTASDGPKQSELHILCLSRDDGEVLWQLDLWGTAPTRYHANKSSMASPTPVTDGQHVYAFFGTGDLFCVTVDGELEWYRSLASEYGRFENRFSATSSPLLYGDTVIVQCDHYGDSYVVAIDKRTGEDRWKLDRPETWLSWSSPQLAPVADGKSELILCASEKIDAVDPATGDKLWTVGGMQRECIPTPIISNGLIYAVSGPNGDSLAIKPGGRGDVSESHVLWRNQRGSPFVPSAIVVGDYYYLVDDQGIATCLNTSDGKRVWQKRLGGAFTASPVATTDRVYFTNEAGETIVIDATADRFKQLAKNDVGEAVYSSPAISQGCLFIRTTRGLVCVGE